MQHWFTYPTNIDPVAIHLGPRFGIHWYGIAYLVAFLCVYLWMSRPAGLRRLGLTKQQIQDFLFYALVGVIVGGRTFFVINDIISKHDASMYVSNPINIIAIWNGGMAFH
ncbi:MAG: prolipoprotein diacylglyceryl transferase family protein, partial [Candidatus Cybelea sp.]